ncbi:hypothetical protein GEMRC1_003613 [Eukaryota sp. GEM-RC1]
MYNNTGMSRSKGSGSSGYVMRNKASAFKPRTAPSSTSTSLQGLSGIQDSSKTSRRAALRENVYLPLAQFEKELTEQNVPEEEKLILIASRKSELLTALNEQFPPDEGDKSRKRLSSQAS